MTALEPIRLVDVSEMIFDYPIEKYKTHPIEMFRRKNIFMSLLDYRWENKGDVPSGEHVWRITTKRRDGKIFHRWYCKDVSKLSDHPVSATYKKFSSEKEKEKYYFMLYLSYELEKSFICEAVLDDIYISGLDHKPVARRLYSLHRPPMGSLKPANVFGVRYTTEWENPVYINLNNTAFDSTILWKEERDGATQIAEIPESITPTVLSILGFDKQPKESSQLLAEWATGMTNEGIFVDSFRGEGHSRNPNCPEWYKSYAK